MPAGITERADGTAEAAFALTPAWHGLGRVLDHPMTSEEAIAEAQLDWTVEQFPVFAGMPEAVPDGNGGMVEETEYVELPHRANVRSDNGTVLGVVSAAYKVVQNGEAFAFLDALVQDEVLRYESAFSLSGGKRVVIVARMPRLATIVEGDEIAPYIMLSTSHDGGGGVELGPTAVRVVCQNTYNMAMEAGGIRRLTIMHTSGIMDRLARARDLLGLADGSFRRHTEDCRRLAATNLARAAWLEYLDVIVPPLRAIDPDHTPRREKAIAETRERILGLYDNDPCQQMDGVRGTAWAAYNAVSQHVDHLPRRGATERARSEARFRVTQQGTGHAIKQRAFAAARKLAGIGAEN